MELSDVVPGKTVTMTTASVNPPVFGMLKLVALFTYNGIFRLL